MKKNTNLKVDFSKMSLEELEKLRSALRDQMFLVDIEITKKKIEKNRSLSNS